MLGITTIPLNALGVCARTGEEQITCFMVHSRRETYQTKTTLLRAKLESIARDSESESNTDIYQSEEGR
jgi:hypothetical protein